MAVNVDGSELEVDAMASSYGGGASPLGGKYDVVGGFHHDM